MNAMEQMLVNIFQRITGLTQEQMQELAKNALEMLQSLDTRLQNIEDSQKKILDYLYPPYGDQPKDIEPISLEDKSDGTGQS